MGNIFSFGWENRLIVYIQQYMSEKAVKIAGLITDFGDAMILVLVIGLVYWSLNKELGKKLVVYLGFVNIINPFLKSAVKRLRPYMADPDIRCLKPVSSEGDIYDVVTQEYSFPSGHANNSVAIYGTIAKKSRSGLLRFLLSALILLVGVSRFALGVHYPTDVLAGWIVAWLAVALYNVLEKKLGQKACFILLDILGLAGFLVARTNDFYTGYGMLLGSTLGILFEEKRVHFKGTGNIFAVLLRTLMGVGLYLGINTLLKLPFSAEFLNSGTVPAFAVRALRYAVIGFVLMGAYPMCFRLFSKKPDTPERKEP